MIAPDGKMHVFLVEEVIDYDGEIASVHDTSDGAAKKLESLGYRYMTAAPLPHYGHGWYRFGDDGCVPDVGRIIEMEVES